MKIPITYILVFKKAIPIDARLFAPAETSENCSYPNLKDESRDLALLSLYSKSAEFIKKDGSFHV